MKIIEVLPMVTAQELHAFLLSEGNKFVSNKIVARHFNLSQAGVHALIAQNPDFIETGRYVSTKMVVPGAKGAVKSQIVHNKPHLVYNAADHEQTGYAYFIGAHDSPSLEPLNQSPPIIFNK